MQTNFKKKQLANPRVAEAEQILKRCVHCGLCTAVCPTYVLTGDERDSPRGRIYMIKNMLEGSHPASQKVQHHLDRCLSCLSCTSTCPSGVDYMHLIDTARGYVEATGNRSFKVRFIRSLLAKIVPYPTRFYYALRAASLARPFVGIMKRVGLKEFAAMIELAPIIIPRARYAGAGTAVTNSEQRARVILLAGCAQQVLRADINDATIRLLARRGVDVVVAHGAGCCGSLVHHLGREKEALSQARRNIDAWTHAMSKGEVDAIIVNASGCGTTVKDYGHMFKHDPKYAEKAERISELAQDVAEFLANYELGPPKRYSSLMVAYHSACSMQHGQRIHDEPKALLRKAGYSVVDIDENHICCGSAGVYNILQPDIAAELRERKAEHIRDAKPDLVATGNIGCITQLAPAVDMPVAHTVELLDWAYGGPVPKGLGKLAKFVSDVPEPRRRVEEFLHV